MSDDKFGMASAVKLKRIVSTSDEIKNFEATNLLDEFNTCGWKGRNFAEKYIYAAIELEKNTFIKSLDVKNNNSAFIEILVGESTDGEPEMYRELVGASILMSLEDAKKCVNQFTTRRFRFRDLIEPGLEICCNYVKIVCWQPYNNESYGISGIKIYADDIQSSENGIVHDVAFFRNKSDLTPISKDDAIECVRPLSGMVSRENPITLLVINPPPIMKKKANIKRTSVPFADENNAFKKPFSKLLEGVVFVISGYQNPYRSQLRAKALEMGAEYKADWVAGCTHLVCAFKNTPKYNSVKGRSRIVSCEWIENCYNKRKKLSWKSFVLDRSDVIDGESDTEISELCLSTEQSSDDDNSDSDETFASPVKVFGKHRQSVDIYETNTDSDSEEGIKDKRWYLPPLFRKMFFYLDPSIPDDRNKFISRYIAAYDGFTCTSLHIATCIITENLNFTLSNNEGNKPILLSDWIWECNDKRKFIPMDEYTL